MRKADKIAFSVPVALVAIVLLLNLIPAFRQTDLRLYDQLLPLRQDVAEDERFIILRVDDEAITRVGGWPWSRDVIANGMWTLKELGADRMVFDIEYMDQSPSGVDRTILEQQVPNAISRQLSSLLDDSLGLLEAVAEGRIPIEDALEFSDMLVDQAEQSQRSILDTVGGIARDNDLYMGRAAEVFERAFYTVTLLDFPAQIAPTTPDDLEVAKERFGLADAPGEHGLERAEAIQPVIQPIGTRAAGAGFTNVVVDPDGVRRRISVLAEYDGRMFGQLSFVPLWNMLGSPEIRLDGRNIILRDALMPGEENPRNVTIPLSTDYRLLINWPQKTFQESFRQESYAALLVYEREMETLYDNLLLMEDAGYFGFFDGTPPTEYFEYAEEIQRDVMSGELDIDWFEDYRMVRAGFLEESDRLLNGGTEAALVSRITEFLEASESDAERAEYRAIIDEARDLFDAARGVHADLAADRERFIETFEDSFIIIGQTGVGTVDIGVNPFEGQYFNVGTHAAVANTILQEDFIVEEPRWISLVVAAILGLGVGLGTIRLDTKKSIIFGVVSLVLVAAGGAGYFVLTSRYLPLVTPLTAVFLAFVSSSAVSAVQNSAERAFLRNAFSRYLSADVIGQIIDDPSRLSLGGDKKFLTAMFTDIQGFSTISETLDPTDLVKLLNAYLTAMSDIVLDVRGTIDKYEGDAIIAFFGAPVDDPDHAAHACASAVRMKRSEVELNERFLADGMTPSPLSTRIGINSGEMVVGNMGTERKMDYTIMGHAVNLAARLEGVNKQYGSHILVSESTRQMCGDEFLFRPFDPVRVVGVSQPVQLFELLDERSAASSTLIERVEQFNEAIELFRGRQFGAARKLFGDLAERFENDGPAQTYLKRCTTYEKTPPPENWDGVYSLTQK